MMILTVVAVLLVAVVAVSGLAVRHSMAEREARVRLDEAEAEVARLTAELMKEDQVEKSEVSEPTPVATVKGVEEALIASLESQISKLRAELQGKDAHILTLQAQQTNAPPEESSRRRDRGAWLEELKDSDPDRYEEIVQAREDSRQRMQEAFAEKANHFLERDTTDMTEDEVAEHARMLELLDQTWALAERMRSGMDWSERRKVMPQMRENIEELMPMLDNERDSEFFQLGVEFGYSEDEAAEFVDYMNQIVEITSMRPVFEAMRGGRGFGGGRREGARETR